ncbi:MAG: hypothetical protein AAGA37_05400 [Actinomycetota bacterium]
MLDTLVISKAPPSSNAAYVIEKTDEDGVLQRWAFNRTTGRGGNDIAAVQDFSRALKNARSGDEQTFAQSLDEAAQCVDGMTSEMLQATLRTSESLVVSGSDAIVTAEGLAAGAESLLDVIAEVGASLLEALASLAAA